MNIKFSYLDGDVFKMILILSNIDHATSTDSSRRGSLKIFDFKKHSECRPQFDSFSICQTKSHVVIQDSVEVLNPHCIYRPIKSDPIMSFFLAVVAFSHNGGEETISPFLSEDIDLAIQLSHCYRFGIDHSLLNDPVRTQVVGIGFDQMGHRLFQEPITGGFTNSSFSNNHDTEPDVDNFIELDNFDRHFICITQFKQIYLLLGS